MATTTNVTVLAPNGRRLNVKVTPNMTILQILEEVCSKQGYNPQKYDLKHLTTLLDTTMIFRFTTLPNNATLEMVPCTKERETTDIRICLQLENSERLTHNFPSTTTLTEILEQLHPNYNPETTGLIYMRQEVFGKDDLASTTLKSLGLTSGNAALRVKNRDPEAPKTQAHVYRPATTKPSTQDTNRPGKNDSAAKRASSAVTNFVSKVSDSLPSMKSDKSKFKNVGPGHVVGHKAQKDGGPAPGSTAPESEARTPKSEKIPKKENTETSKNDGAPVDEKIEFLGERNALLFSQAGAKALPREELPDNFFDVTVDDAKALMRDARKQREALTDAPLSTSAQRELESNKSTLKTLHKYRRAVIRIQFPNQLVLQGLFGPLETIQNVKDFVKGYLASPDKEFALYTTPPRQDLLCDKRLIDENLVPSAIIYYSGKSDLKSELKSKLTDPRAAGLAAIKSRIATTREEIEDSSQEDLPDFIEPARSTPATVVDRFAESEPGPSRSESANQNDSSVQAPKWFKRFLK